MARKKSPTLTEAELRLMDILWQKESATVSDVASALPRKLSLAYNTVLTTLRILERKGYVTHKKQGRAFLYSPAVDRSSARKRAVKHLVSRFFNNSPELLVLNLLENEKLDATELERLKALIREKE